MIEREALVPRDRRADLGGHLQPPEAEHPARDRRDAPLRAQPLDRPLRVSELNSDSPFNTRKRRGLPPTPIGNPGLAVAARPRAPGERAVPVLRRQAVRQRRPRLLLDRRAVPAGRRSLQPQARAAAAARTRRTAEPARRCTPPRRPRLAGRSQPLARDANAALAALGLTRLALRAPAGPARASSRRPSPRSRRRLRRGQRHDPAQGGGARARRRATRRPRRAIGAANTLTLRRRRARSTPTTPTPRAARRAPGEPARGQRARAGRRRQRPRRGLRAARGRRRGRGLEPHRRAGRRAGRRSRRRGGRRPVAAEVLVNCTSCRAARSGREFKELPVTADAIGQYACVVDLVYRDRRHRAPAQARAPGVHGGRRSRDPRPPGRAELSRPGPAAKRRLT